MVATAAATWKLDLMRSGLVADEYWELQCGIIDESGIILTCREVTCDMSCVICDS